MTSGAPKDGIIRFVGTRLEKWGPDNKPVNFDTTQHVLAVFLDSAQGRPDGVAYAMIDRTVACPGNTVASVSFASYSADGKLKARASALPDYAAKAMEQGWIKYLFDEMCKRATHGLSPMPPMPSPPPLNPDYQASPRAKTPTEALAVAHQYEADMAAAMNWAPEGKFRIGAPIPEHGLPILDMSTLTAPGGKKHISWAMVGRARWHPYGDDVRSYMRTTYDVDCDAKTARTVLVGYFDGDGQLYRVSGASDTDQSLATSDSSPIERALGTYILAACASDGPGLFEKTFKTFPEALAQARKQLGL